MKKYSYILKNLDCAVCAGKIETKLSNDKRFQNVNVNFNTLKLNFETDLEKNIKQEVSNIVNSVEPEIQILSIEEINNKNTTSKKSLIKLIIGTVLALVSNYLPLPSIILSLILLIAYAILLSRTVINAYKLLKNSHNIDENFLITISCIGAYLVGEHMEGLMVIILYEIGKILEDKAVNRTRNSINELMNIRPEYANLLKGTEIKVKPEEVEIGSIVIVKKGEKIPLDGIIIKGESVIDTSSLTGESKPVKVQVNSEVLSGSINIGDVIEIKTTNNYQNSTVSKILELVENASDKKAKSETFASNFAKVYTPVVIILAVIVGLSMPIMTDLTYSESIYKALTFLVISCPCAIAISVPLSYFSGIGRASKAGILIKGSSYLDSLKNLKEIIFDKTGTITTGIFEISEINIKDDKYTKEDIKNYIIAGEKLSTHPLAKSIITEIKETKNVGKITHFNEQAGKGISYKVNNKKVKIGSSEFVETNEKYDNYGTVIYLKIDDLVVGNIVMRDKIKKETKTVMKKLHHLGIRTRMFTGDNREVANYVARESLIDEVYAELLPNDKYKKLEELLKAKKEKEIIAFIGDGINDSPVLTLADIGISMGGVGSAAAIEASDIVIMTDELTKILEAIKISKKTNTIIKQNLFFAIGTKVLVLFLTIIGISNMWQAIFADVGVTLIAILNTLRILKTNK